MSMIHRSKQARKLSLSPIRENGQFVGYVNVLQQRAKRWKDNGEVEKVEVPEYSKENLGICREALMEAVAETSEEFMDRYFGGEEFSEDEIRQALRVNVSDGSIVPVLMGSNVPAGAGGRSFPLNQLSRSACAA